MPQEILQFLVLLSISLGAFMLSQQFRMSLAVGYLLAGMLMGPSVLGILEKTSFFKILGHIGILLFLFTVGLELPLHRLRSMKRYIFGLGGIQVFLSAILIGIGGALLYEKQNSFVVLTIISLAFAFSSTAIIIQLLSEKFELTTHLGRSAIAILLLQDIVAIGVFVFLDIIETQSDTSNLWFSLLYIVFGIALTIGIARLITWITIKLFSRYRYSEFTTVFVLLCVVGMSAFTEKFQLSPELGAFVVGVALAGTHWRHQISSEIHPFRTIFLAFFFIVMGLEINIPSYVHYLRWLPSLTISFFFILFIKGLVVFFGARIFRLNWKIALKLGVLMAGCGEFLFMILPSPFLMEKLGKDVVNTILTLAFLSMVATPFLFHSMKYLMGWLNKETKPEYERIPEIKNQVIVVGFGRVGETVARILEHNFISFLIIDYDILRIKKAQKEHFPVIHGDARDFEFLKKKGIQKAKVLLITFGHMQTAVELVRSLRYKFPELAICVQVKDYHHASRFVGLGAHVIVPERIESGIQMASLTLQFLGFSSEYAQKMVYFSQTPTFFGKSQLLDTDTKERN